MWHTVELNRRQNGINFPVISWKSCKINKITKRWINKLSEERIIKQIYHTFLLNTILILCHISVT